MFKGKRVMQALGTDKYPCTTLPDAKRLLRDLQSDLERTDVVASKKTLKAIIAEYKAVMPFSESTKEYKTLYLDQLGKEFPAGTKVSDIKTSQMLKFLSKYEGKAAATKNHVITVCRDLFRYAISDRVIAASPIEGIKYKRSKTTVKRLIPSWAEFEAIVMSVRTVVFSDTSKQSADLIEFMGKAGLGQGECASLRWQDINFETSKIVIVRQKTGHEFSVPIFDTVRPLLERMNLERENPSPTDPVFKVKDPKKGLDSACKRLNLPKYSARAFRRMFITRCLELGIDAQTIASWQGHRDGGQLILKVYARVTDSHTRRMASLMVAPNVSEKVIPIGVAAA
ncbi:MAG: site-specific integrase [Verrucomicrobiota bacterium]